MAPTLPLSELTQVIYLSLTRHGESARYLLHARADAAGRYWKVRLYGGAEGEESGDGGEESEGAGGHGVVLYKGYAKIKDVSRCQSHSKQLGGLKQPPSAYRSPRSSRPGLRTSLLHPMGLSQHCAISSVPCVWARCTSPYPARTAGAGPRWPRSARPRMGGQSSPWTLPRRSR